MTLKTDKLFDFLPDNEGCLIAYSGGVDSTALLYLLSGKKNTRAIHINHGIQKQADNWQKHCQLTCEKLNIPLIVEQAHLTNKSEEACRNARYDFFEKHLNANEVLLTAHHQNDQAETVLLKLLRGTGIKGLSGMVQLKKFKSGFLARPFLGIQQKELINYLHKNNIEWIEDSSNKNDSYKRNFIRNQILTRLHPEFPSVIENITRSALNSQNTIELLNHLCDFQDYSLPLYKLQGFPEHLKTSYLYQWLSQKNIPIPPRKALEQIKNDFINAGIDKHPHFETKFYQLKRSFAEIYCIKNYTIIKPDKSFNWDTSKDFIFPNSTGKLSYNGKNNFNLTVKFNQTGHKIKTHEQGFHKTVKKLFQDQKVPIWEKQNTPFVYHNNQLISLGYQWSNTNEFNGKIIIKLKNLII